METPPPPNNCCRWSTMSCAVSRHRNWHRKNLGTLSGPRLLVHEAYLRLVDTDRVQHWNSRGHFFVAAAESMRRILVEAARRKQQIGRGGDRQRVPFDDLEIAADAPSDDILALDESLGPAGRTRSDRCQARQAAVLCRNDHATGSRRTRNFAANGRAQLDLRKIVAPPRFGLAHGGRAESRRIARTRSKFRGGLCPADRTLLTTCPSDQSSRTWIMTTTRPNRFFCPRWTSPRRRETGVCRSTMWRERVASRRSRGAPAA